MICRQLFLPSWESKLETYVNITQFQDKSGRVYKMFFFFFFPSDWPSSRAWREWIYSCGTITNALITTYHAGPLGTCRFQSIDVWSLSLKTFCFSSSSWNEKAFWPRYIWENKKGSYARVIMSCEWVGPLHFVAGARVGCRNPSELGVHHGK